jgi:Ca2+:H+ antiporter
MKGVPSIPHFKTHGGTHRSSRRPDSNSVPLNSPANPNADTSNNGSAASSPRPGPQGGSGDAGGGCGLASAQPAPPTDPDSSSSRRPVNTSQATQPGAVVGAEGEKQEETPNPEEKKPIMHRFWRTLKAILLHSKINVLLAFVPVGIAIAQTGASPAVIFAMNAIAIVPLAGLLSFATESVAHRLGDSLGALLNVTFGNAVELIIL